MAATYIKVTMKKIKMMVLFSSNGEASALWYLSNRKGMKANIGKPKTLRLKNLKTNVGFKINK